MIIVRVVLLGQDDSSLECMEDASEKACSDRHGRGEESTGRPVYGGRRTSRGASHKGGHR